jgi:hypothetical protein
LSCSKPILGDVTASAAIGVAAFAAAVVVHLVLRRTGAAASLGARAG